MKEFKVSIWHQEDDNYNELWKVVGEEKYFARNTYYGGDWYFVADPLGYCELDHSCPDDYVFIVCNHKGKELFRSSNADDTRNFPCLRVLRKQEWDKVKTGLAVKEENNDAAFFAHWATGNIVSHHGTWLLSFKDPDIYGDKAKDYDENWCWWYKETGKQEVLGKFKYAGDTYEIVKSHVKHDICGVEWDEFYSAGEFMGAIYDQTLVGTMYSKQQAISKARKALADIYPDSKYNISAVNVYKYGEDTYITEQQFGLGQAAERILNGDYHRIAVDAAIEKEQKTPSFYKDIYDIRKTYPDCQYDLSMSYKY